MMSYDRLLRLLQIKPGIGAPASNIRRLERLGVEVTYQQGTLTDLDRHLQQNTPCLAFVKTEELLYWDEASDHAVGFDCCIVSSLYNNAWEDLGLEHY